MPPEPLDRFLRAPQAQYATALAELRAGHKTSHWIWFVLPQLRVLGRSAMAHQYGLADRVEAQAYLAHPVLGARLAECVEAMLAHRHTTAAQVLGDIDAIKFRSCLTLFDAVSAAPDNLFRQALDVFYRGEPDAATLALL